MESYQSCFTDIVDRRGKDAIALDQAKITGFLKGGTIKEGFDPIPMWIADMSFSTVPTVVQAIKDRADHAIYGYYPTSDAYYDHIIQWQTELHGATGLDKDCIGYENGVLGGLMSAMGVLCSAGEKVLVHSPTYVGFTNSMGNAGYNLVHSPLVLDEAGIWRMDFADMEEKIQSNHIRTAIFCSPHNPSGRVWEAWEVEQVMALYQKYDIFVVSDEIWADLTLGDHRHIPLQSVSEDARNRTIALYAPSKTFNLAGLVGAYHIIYNKYLRERMRRQASLCHYNAQNVLSMHALMAAYSPEGRTWLKELRQVLTDNIDYGYRFFTETIKGVQVSKPQGTYILYLDCTQWCEEHGVSLDELQQRGFEHGVIWQDGRLFKGTCHIRMNFANPKARIVEAMDRLQKYVFCD